MISDSQGGRIKALYCETPKKQPKPEGGRPERLRLMRTA